MNEITIYREMNTLKCLYWNVKLERVSFIVEVSEQELEAIKHDTLDKVHLLLNELIYKKYKINI